ncbi:glycerate kinase [Anaerobacillus sp. CMMVII]|uniref:glycerate kinase n=1 Tax=Anaerobacillus sp. CMMVII TaxID=2755588 RepID=UPI0021B7D183|nr:glycerate kinase [Anaerobacillus sp. CMMVII]MCT8137147.1 glycerate kinase [Anaerobacillus sp. CMMVII]
MKIVLAPDSFKESMTAKNAALAMERGIHKVFPDAKCVIVPMADGGEGTVESLVDLTDGEIMETQVVGPLGETIFAQYGLSGDGKLAIIEMASASGIHLLKKEERNPLKTTSFGTGQLIKAAVDKGVTRIIMGIGGSVTNDAGVGMLQALGCSFKDRNGNELPYGGGNLGLLHEIDVSQLDPRLASVSFEVACDVTNPLIGKNGASYIFGPQKGATPEMVEQLDQNLTHFSELVKVQLGKDIAEIEGGGAAGGLGASLLAFLDAFLKKGIDLVIDYTNLEEKIIGADYVFTGEGSIDHQTIYGKTPFGVATISEKHGVPVIAFAGRVGDGVQELYSHGFTAIIGILNELTSLDDALKAGEINLELAVENICRIIEQERMIECKANLSIQENLTN